MGRGGESLVDAFPVLCAEVALGWGFYGVFARKNRKMRESLPLWRGLCLFKGFFYRRVWWFAVPVGCAALFACKTPKRSHKDHFHLSSSLRLPSSVHTYKPSATTEQTIIVEPA